MKPNPDLLRNIRWTRVLSHFAFFAVLLGLNLLVSQLIKSSNIYFVSNIYPFGIQIGTSGISIIVALATWGIFNFNLIHKYPIYSILILSGVWSNCAERFLFGFVTDYINLGISFANLADLQIWVGVIILNVIVWLPESKNHDSKHNINLGL
jgi:hypothetical protein